MGGCHTSHVRPSFSDRDPWRCGERVAAIAAFGRSTPTTKPTHRQTTTQAGLAETNLDISEAYRTNDFSQSATISNTERTPHTFPSCCATCAREDGEGGTHTTNARHDEPAISGRHCYFRHRRYSTRSHELLQVSFPGQRLRPNEKDTTGAAIIDSRPPDVATVFMPTVLPSRDHDAPNTYTWCSRTSTSSAFASGTFESFATPLSPLRMCAGPCWQQNRARGLASEVWTAALRSDDRLAASIPLDWNRRIMRAQFVSSEGIPSACTVIYASQLGIIWEPRAEIEVRLLTHIPRPMDFKLLRPMSLLCTRCQAFSRTLLCKAEACDVGTRRTGRVDPAMQGFRKKKGLQCAESIHCPRGGREGHGMATAHVRLSN